MDALHGWCEWRRGGDSWRLDAGRSMCLSCWGHHLSGHWTPMAGPSTWPTARRCASGSGLVARGAPCGAGMRARPGARCSKLLRWPPGLPSTPKYGVVLRYLVAVAARTHEAHATHASVMDVLRAGVQLARQSCLARTLRIVATRTQQCSWRVRAACTLRIVVTGSSSAAEFTNAWRQIVTESALQVCMQSTAPCFSVGGPRPVHAILAS